MNSYRRNYLALTATFLTLGCNPSPQASERANPADEKVAPQSSIAVSEAWAAETPAGAWVAAGYLTITNRGADADTLMGIVSARAPRVQLHEIVMDGDIARMRQMPEMAITPNETLTLTPGGYHLMFLDIPTPFLTGENIPVTLTFAHAGRIEIQLPVRQRDVSQGNGAPGGADHMHDHH